jgi:hemoglobin-like flavoprotein
MYNFLSYHMIRGLLAKKPELAHDDNIDNKNIAKAQPAGCPYSGIVVSQSKSYVESPAQAPSSVQDEFDVMTPISYNEVSYEMVTMVLDSWENKLQQIPNFLQVTGEMFMRKSFEIYPETKEMFGFPGARHDDPALSRNKTFMAKGVRLMRAIDMTLSFLGPDLQPLEQTLFDLGKRHVARQCKPKHWPAVGEVLFYIFEETLGDEFTPELRQAWTGKYEFSC